MSAAQGLQFDIEVTQNAGSSPLTYRIRIVSPVGESTHTAPAPFTQDEIERLLTVLGGADAEPRPTRTEMNAAGRILGERLFILLFRTDDRASNAYFASLDRAAARGVSLRFRLSVENAGALASLPWEFLRDPARDSLALSRATPILRYTQQLSIRAVTPATIPLRALVILSSPANFPALDVEGEWARLQTATADLRARGVIELERLERPTLIALQRRLRTVDYHIIHFVGHSDFDSEVGQGVLVFESETPDADGTIRGQIVSAAALGREIGEETTVRLVILNSCHSARRPDSDPLAGIASGLVARGIPAVIAMQFAITDRAAQTFAEEFYRAIADALPVDTALSEARRAIANRHNSAEWATPVLFMRAPDGVLFAPSPGVLTPTTTSVPPPPTSPLKPIVTPPRRPPWGWIALITGIIVGFIGLALLLPGGALNPAPIPSPTPSITPVPTVSPTASPMPLLADLQASRPRVSPSRPAPGQIFRVNITIQNVGTADSGAFTYSWDSDLNAPNGEGLNSYIAEVDNIPPGASRSVSFTFIYGWWDTYSTQVVIDAQTEVDEANELNNRAVLSIVMADTPFDIDFSFLPVDQNMLNIEPGLRLVADAFIPWNLDFTLNEQGGDTEACASAPLAIIEVNETTGDLALAPSLTVDPLCARGTLITSILRRPVSATVLELVPVNNGTATVIFYGDAEGTQILETVTTSVVRDVPITIATADETEPRIARIDIRVLNQRLQLTRLILFKPIDE